MVAMEIFEKLTKLPQVSYIGLEDSIDRLNFQVTVVLLLAFCTTCTFKTYILSPVSCFLPNEVGAHSGQEQYVNNYCWTEGTYAVPLREFKIDGTNPEWAKVYEGRKIMYYQWVPFVLGLQALLFYLPRVLWSLLSSNRAGTDVDHLIRSANDAVAAEGEKHEKLVQHVCRRLEQTLCQPAASEGLDQTQQQSRRSKRLINRLPGIRRIAQISAINRLLTKWSKLRKRFGIWLLVLYFFIKLCYLANAIGQLFLMQKFLGFNASNFMFGATVLNNLRNGRDWQHTMIFPRVGCCAVYFRGAALGNYIFSQCTLPINMINEKMYIFLWFWILGIAVFTFCSLPLWMYHILWVNHKAKVIKGYLRLCDNSEAIDKRDINRFVRKFLRHDGVFLLRMIALNSGDVICTEIVCRLWSGYMQRIYGQVQMDEYYTMGEQSAVPPAAEAAAPAEDATLLKRFNSNPDDSCVERDPCLKQQLSEPGPD